MSKRSLFSSEEKIIKNARSFAEKNNQNPLITEFNKLLKNYVKLYKQTSRLVKMSDRQQEQLRQAEEALKKSEEKYRGLYNSSKDGIIYMDINFNILESNPSFTDMTGYSHEEIIKLDLLKLTPKKWHDIEKKITKEIMLKGYSDEYEKELYTKDGLILSVASRSWIIKDKQDQFAGIWSIIRDISERKRAEQIREDVERMVKHDLKTPLNGVINLSERMKKYIEKEMSWASQIHEIGSNLLKINEFSKDSDKILKDNSWITNDFFGIINIKQALGRLMGKKEVFVTSLKEFKNDYSNYVNSIKDYYQKKEFDKAFQYTNSLKSLAATFAATQLENTATALENAFKNKENDNTISILIQSLDNEHNKILNIIPDIIKKVLDQ